MEIKGQVVDIRYQNEINSYTIATLESEEGELTVVGYLPFVNTGDVIMAEGDFVVHQEYGEQFKINTFEKLMPESLEGLEKYLANGTIKGIGPATAKKIIETFGEETVSIFRFEPAKLAQIKGITKEKAMQMGEDFVQNWDVWQLVGFLEQYGIGASSAKRIYKELGPLAREEIEANPYLLVALIRNIDFKKIDKMALALGIAYDNKKRIQSGIQYSLMKISYHGHCCTLKQNLLQFVGELLGVPLEEIEDCLIDLKVKEQIVIEEREEEQWVYLSSFYEAEQQVAQKIILLNSTKNRKRIPHFQKEITNAERRTNLILSDKQKEAVEAVNNDNVCVITGGPGTGKTTIIKTILDIYRSHGKKVVLCAPTGRAAKRMTETTEEEAKTLHRLLEIGKIEEEGPWRNSDLEVSPIDADVIIVDEMSMVDLFLMNYLVKGIYLGTKLVLVGDSDQLPSVGPGSILKDLIASGKIMTVHLDKIFRQAAKSNIILNAHRVNEGEAFLSKEEKKDYEDLQEDFFFINETKQETILEQVISLCKGRLKIYGDYDFFENIQVLSPTKKGLLGTRELNRRLQHELNPETIAKEEKKSGEILFREGDRVMQIKNNYDIYWEKEKECGSGIFNGELGEIRKIDKNNKQIKIEFDDKKSVWYSFSELDQLEHAYAITIHKAQRK